MPRFAGHLCCLRLFEFEGSRIELVVFATFGDQVRVAAALDDATVFEHHDHV